MARSLFVDGLRWLWIGDEPGRRRGLLGDLLHERHRLCVLLEETGAGIGNQPRWMMPLPDVADLTGESLSWLDAPVIPGDAELLEDFLAHRDSNAEKASVGQHAPLLRRTQLLLDMSGLRGTVMVLAHAGHGNYLGLLSSLTEDGAVGHDLRPDHEALFMQVAAAGVTATLLGTATSVPELWPEEVALQPYLERAVELTADVAAAAVPLHGLDSARRPPSQSKRSHQQQRPIGLLRGGAVLFSDDLWPDINSAHLVVQAAEGYYELARSMVLGLWDNGNPTLHAALAYGGGHSNLEAVMATYDRTGSAAIAVFAARMLIEEAARMLWRYTPADPEDVKTRAKQYFDEFRARQKSTINTLTGSGVSAAAARRVFARPGNVTVETPDDVIAKGRLPLPTITSMLREMGEPFPEPGWLEVAYSLLSQFTHSTPIGLLHTVRFRDGTWHGNEISTELLALTLDAACLGSAHVLGMSAILLTDASDSAVEYRRALLRQAMVVHALAREVHGLD
ncbi:hypothetical protein JNUCC0626_47450 [Lentzea sp. JNUCC 0626]|uniref:hypothetical protein n=1 Tax=Lentzea sp. JNUCC 0626 TaxID=3367513 RepID=UPI00374A7224